MPTSGHFVISLDFELYWGVRDMYPISYYRKQMSGEKELIPRLLKMLEEHCIHATWAIVGLMFFDSMEEMLNGIPEIHPDYINANLSPYPYIENGAMRNNESEYSEHIAPELIKEIQKTNFQQISTHTFSHYYCLEEGQDIAQFRADLLAAIRIAEKKNTKIESIIFPRNQFNESYISVLKELGIRSYRGNPTHWIHRKGYSDQDSIFKRALRLIDTYYNLSGHNCFSTQDVEPTAPVNLPASHFLRPYSKKLRFLEPLRLRRILSSMTYAAKHGLVYHLWWHPYNFAVDQEENLNFLKKIIDHYHVLNKRYGMISTSMEDLADTLLPSQIEEILLQNAQ